MRIFSWVFLLHFLSFSPHLCVLLLLALHPPDVSVRTPLTLSAPTGAASTGSWAEGARMIVAGMGVLLLGCGIIACTAIGLAVEPRMALLFPFSHVMSSRVASLRVVKRVAVALPTNVALRFTHSPLKVPTTHTHWNSFQLIPLTFTPLTLLPLTCDMALRSDRAETREISRRESSIQTDARCGRLKRLWATALRGPRTATGQDFAVQGTPTVLLVNML